MSYISRALRTAAATTHPVNMQLLHCAIGMVTEAAERDDAQTQENFLEETGDIMWYVAIGCNELGLTLEEAEEMAANPDAHPVQIAANFIDLLKKQIYYGKRANPVDQTVLLGDMIACLRADCLADGTDLETIMEQNIAKLQRRYPEKFTEERAINR